MRFRLTPRSMTFDDLDLLYVRILSEFLTPLNTPMMRFQILEPTAAKRIKIEAALSATEL